MRVKDLKDILYSDFGGIMQYGIVAEEGCAEAIRGGALIDYYISEYADREVKRIFAEDGNIVIILREEKQRC